MKELVVFIFVILLLAIVASCSMPAVSQQPAIVTAQPAIFEGSVQGHVLADGSGESIPGARVWLINATNNNTSYGTTVTDNGGYYYFVGVVPMKANAYRLKAQRGKDTGFSPSFSVAALENKTVDVYVHMSPSSIHISAPRNYVVADGSDHTGITAIVSDSLGRPVAGGFPITFKARGDRPGSLYGSIVPDRAVTDASGSAAAQYGWVPTVGAASLATIEVFDGAGVNASFTIDIRVADSTPPATRLMATGEPDNAGGFISDVIVTLAAVDTGWGVNETYYRVGDSGWTRYSGPITISGEGGTTIYYYSTDLAGNRETPKNRTIVIHKKMN